jgi:cell wall-associated NlpC family hydrolase
MIKRTDIVAAARSLLGSKWLRGGREPSAGLDCGGLVVAVSNRLGYHVHDKQNYSIDGDGRLYEYLLESFDEVKDPQPGDILLFRLEPDKLAVARHCAILVDNGRIIHTSTKLKKVVEHTCSPLWLKRVRHCLCWRGVDQWQP